MRVTGGDGGDQSAGTLLLSAPRGRRLFWEVLEKAPLITSPDDTTPWTPLPDQSPELLLSSARAALRHVDLDALQRVQDPALLMPALAASVDSARYWQAPDDTDLALDSPDVQDLLLPVAEAVLQCPAALWWDDPVDVADQHRATEQRDDAQPPGNPDSAAELAEWRRATVQDENRAAKERPADPAASWGGWWWSAPALTELVTSSSTIPGSRTPSASSSSKTAPAPDACTCSPSRSTPRPACTRWLAPTTGRCWSRRTR